jgi:hypothetical protein
MTPEARRILVEAKGLVSRGWFQLGPNGIARAVGEGTDCPLTACGVTGQKLGVSSALEEAVQALADAAGVDHIPTWNDVPERTHEEVVALFDKALLADTQPTAKRSTPKKVLA